MPDTCPSCGAAEIDHNSPRTVYACGSSDYDQRPGTFLQSEECANQPTNTMSEETEVSNELPRPETNPIENEIRAIKQARVNIDQIIQTLRAMVNTPERSAAIMKLQEGVMWLGMDLKRIKDETGIGANPYPESYNPDSPRIEPTADNLKL